MAEWIGEYFDRGYAQRWGLEPPSEATYEEVRRLSELLQLQAGERLLDIGCGHGRHAVAFSAHGVSVTGLDSSAALLYRARDLADRSRVAVRWVRGDMRLLPFRPQRFQAAILFDAFGFFATEEEHEVALREAARVLGPGGRLGLKVVNAEAILASFQSTGREERAGAIVEISRALTLDPPRVTERIVISGARGDGRYERRQRLYRIGDLSVMLRTAGLAMKAVLADSHGAAFDPALSPAMLLICEHSPGTAEHGA